MSEQQQQQPRQRPDTPFALLPPEQMPAGPWAGPRLGFIGRPTYTIDANGNASFLEPQQPPASRPTQRNPFPPQWVQQGHDYISEAEAKQSPWFKKNMGILRDTLKDQLEERGLDKNGSKETLAIRLARHQMQQERASVPMGQDRRARSSSASYERSS